MSVSTDSDMELIISRKKNKFNLDCPFCKYYDEIFDHIFKCNPGLFHTRCLYATELVGFCSESSIPKVLKIGVFLEKCSKYREEMLWSSCSWLLVHGLFLMVLMSVFLDLFIYYLLQQFVFFYIFRIFMCIFNPLRSAPTLVVCNCCK